MVTSPKIAAKCGRLVTTYTRLMFRELSAVPSRILKTSDHLRVPPPMADPKWRDAPVGTAWGCPWGSAWFAAHFRVPGEAAGRPLFVRAETDGIEALLFVNGETRGIFTHPRDGADIGNHHTLLAVAQAKAGEVLHIAVEAYAGHPCVGSQPFDSEATQGRYPARYPRVFRGISIHLRRDEVMDFVFDLQAVVQLVESLPDGFRRGKLLRLLEDVFTIVPQDPELMSEEAWGPALVAAREIMAPHLALPAEPSAGQAGLVGHSHMDTAWMWPLEETTRKCARTYSNVLNLLGQYPEFIFVQSTPFHAELMRRHYPAIFEGIKARVAEGRWEPNGGMWVECDCNLTGGEAMVRQFLKGIAFTREHFRYTPDTFWLPDTFGYSAAIPQIMRGCGLRYFLTTKLTWNEVNTFPYDTFIWRGLDGSEVLTHFNDIQCWPDPRTLRAKLLGGGPRDFRTVENHVRHKDVNDRRLISYGMGDGGGGPQFEMIEMARRCADLEGCPRAGHTTVSAFMRGLEETMVRPPVYSGELYLEGHRGSLTSLHGIKRGSRRAESALRDAEILLVASGRSQDDALREDLSRAWETLLVNQFHDILPGTSIPEVHDRAIAELRGVEDSARDVCRSLLGTPGAKSLSVTNTLSWARRGVLALSGTAAGSHAAGLVSQRVVDLEGREVLLVRGPEVPALSSVELKLGQSKEEESPFAWDGRRLVSPEFEIAFDAAGAISSCVVRASRREICREGAPLNAFLWGEDVPASWDNWDIDEDQHLKLAPQTNLLSREVVADGPLEFRLRSVYAIGRGSRLRQDLILRVGSPALLFETEVEWRDKHALLKVAFPTRLNAPRARHEIQFGHIERPVLRNDSHEAVKFEVCQHKWTDLSENRHGVALLNDCKYGVSTHPGELRLTLLKGGTHPDPRGDEGLHWMTYALVPHEGGFSAETVIHPAWELNHPLLIGGNVMAGPLLSVNATNVVLEAIKAAEDGRGFIVRLYEAERSSCTALVKFGRPVESVLLCNLLEEDGAEVPVRDNEVSLDFRAFGIISLRVIPADMRP